MRQSYLSDAMRQAILKGQSPGLMSENLKRLMQGMGSLVGETYRGMKADHAAFHHELGQMRHAATGTEQPYEEWTKTDPLLKGMSPKPAEGDPSFAAVDYGTMAPAAAVAGMLKGVAPKAQKAARNLMRKEYARRQRALSDEPLTEFDQMVNEVAGMTAWRDFGNIAEALPNVKATRFGSSWNLGEPFGVATSFDPYVSLGWRGSQSANRVLNLFGARPSDVTVQGFKGGKHDELLKDAYAYAFGKTAKQQHLPRDPDTGKLLQYDYQGLADQRTEFGKHMSDYLQEKGFKAILYGMGRFAGQGPYGEAEIKMLNPADVIKLEALRSSSDPAIKRMHLDVPAILRGHPSRAMPKTSERFGISETKDFGTAFVDAVWSESGRISGALVEAAEQGHINPRASLRIQGFFDDLGDDINKLLDAAPNLGTAHALETKYSAALRYYKTYKEQLASLRKNRKSRIPADQEAHEHLYESVLKETQIAIEDRLDDIAHYVNLLVTKGTHTRKAVPQLERYRDLTQVKPGSLGDLYKEITPEDMQQRLMRLNMWE